MAEPPPRNLTGVVIITLPPPDNPSLGKTITAYTISDEDDSPPPSQLPNSAHPSPVTPSLLHRTRRALLPIVCISLIALFAWASISISQQARFFVLHDPIGNGIEEDGGNKRERNKSESTFVFPLYKRGFMNNGNLEEVKLGKFVGFDLSKRRRRGKVAGRGGIGGVVSAGLKVDQGQTSVVPVKGEVYPDGLYYTYMHFGNPPKPYFLDMDTGSDLTWLQCDAPCASCAKGPHPFYKPLISNIIPPRDSFCVEVQRSQGTKCESCRQCDYEIEYADQSSSMGVLARDELYLNIANGSSVNSKVVFGCAYDQQGLLLNTLAKTDGILGLSRAKISLPSQLAGLGIIKNVIGHCLATEATDGGYLFLGDDFVPYRQMTWVPMIHSNSINLYQTEMVKMSYGNRQLRLGNVGNGNRRLVIDTGSSYSYFTEEAYNDLLLRLNDVSNEELVRDFSDTSLPICWRAKSPLRMIISFSDQWQMLGSGSNL